MKNNFYKLTLFFSFMFLLSAVQAQDNNKEAANLVTKSADGEELNLKDIDLGYKKIKVETYNLLAQQNEVAKVKYAKMKTHPKLIAKSQGEKQEFANKLKQYKLISLSYIGKDIRFNSLFIKTIVENPKVHYISISPTEAFLYTDMDVNTEALSTQLNDISLTPIKVITQ